MARPPHVVFVLTDDQGYPPLGAHGHPLVRTPHLDAFHGGAARLLDFHSGTTCAPTRAGLLTGHHANSTGVWHTVGGRSLLRRGERTLADALSEAGYATGLFGKWHLGDAYPYRAQDRGFGRTVVHGGGGIGQVPDSWGNDYFDDTYSVDGVPTAFRGYCTDVFFREALKFIEEHHERRPVFCMISTNAPHHPFNVEERYRAMYAGRTKTESYARFLGMISNIDENFGLLRTRLAGLGIEDDTVLIFASDNGQCGIAAGPERAYNAGMRGYKGSMYEGGHRIPLFARWPGGGIGRPGGLDVRALTAYIDFAPTVLDLCGVPFPPAGFHGRSLAALLRGSAPDPAFLERTVVTDTQRVPYPVKWRLSCVMQGRWRLVNRTELYDLAADPGQRNNIAGAHPGLVAELRAAYEEWWELCAARAGEDVPVSLGAAGTAAAVLTAHDLRNERGDGVWNQGQVRAGEMARGWWEVCVERAGRYGFELRRWPEEAARAAKEGIEGADVGFRRDAVDAAEWGWYEGGKALDLRTARVEVLGGQVAEVPVGDRDLGSTVVLQLPKGNARVRAIFVDGNGEEVSAYYVYVRLAGPERGNRL
ncbi:arylsulfatase [Hyaloraphidium curvatum]|nr:arylsulfatase [Hyaloraphidium curvatum]